MGMLYIKFIFHGHLAPAIQIRVQGHEQQRGCKPPWFLSDWQNFFEPEPCNSRLIKIEQDSPGKLHALEHASKIWEELLLVGCVTSSYPTIVGVRDKWRLILHHDGPNTMRRSGVILACPHISSSLSK